MNIQNKSKAYKHRESRFNALFPKRVENQSQLFSQLRNYPIKQIMYTILNKSMKA